MFVKICGLKTKEAALTAATNGADFIGMIFAKSKRQVSIEDAQQISFTIKNLGNQTLKYKLPTREEMMNRLGINEDDYSIDRMMIWYEAWTEEAKQFISTNQRPLIVGVFVDMEPTEINEIVTQVGLDLVQLHGKEPLNYAQEIICPVIRVISMTPKKDINMEEIKEHALMERLKSECGVGFNAFILLDAGAGGTGEVFDWKTAEGIDLPFILAGGLNPTNINKAREVLHPWAVDVSSGVETNGIKDHSLIKQFIQNGKVVNN